MSHEAICDTVSLWLKVADFYVTRPEFFSPHANDVLLHQHVANKKAVQNMSAQDKQAHRYKPKLTLATRFCNSTVEAGLYIELSLPKLLYGENLHEVTDNDFPQIVALLQQVLSVMGIEATEEVLKRTVVNRIHYGKNILLPVGVWCDFVMKDIEKANVSKIYDSGHTDYRNDGHCIRFHTRYHEFAIYDKIKDLKQQNKSPSRSLEDETHRAYQRVDFAELGNMQIFRIETRFNSTKAINRALERAGLVISSCTFETLFNSHIAKTLNLYHWRSILRAMQPLICLQDDLVTMWMRLSAQNKPLKCLQILALRCLMDVTSCRFITEHLKDNPTAMKLFRELKSYESQSSYKEKLYDDITKAIAENNVIELPDLICHKSEAIISENLYADLDEEKPEPVQKFQSWTDLDVQQRKQLNYSNKHFINNI
ncbi:MAG: hypothetical protein IJ529_03555 [Alphaproteobacteria bacterium]|nr:hypothetical protein [Alphaproteobacteria bacterium]